MTYKKSAEMKQNILAAAIRLGYENGYNDLSIKDIAEELQIPRSLIYYYYENKDAILSDYYCDVFGKLNTVSKRLVNAQENQLLHMLLRYILFFRFVMLDPLLRHYHTSRGLHVSQGREGLLFAERVCYVDVESVFKAYGIEPDEDTLFAYIISSDALIAALFEGMANGVLNFTLEQTIFYFGERIIQVTFQLKKEEFSQLVADALVLSEQIEAL